MTATKSKKKVKFLSSYPNLSMIRVSPDYEYDKRGQIIGTEKPGKNDSPFTIDFADGEFETDDSTLIDYIRETDQFNVSVWEEGKAPDEPTPTYADQMEIVLDSIHSRDVDALKKLVKDEKSGHKRAPILQAAESAIEKLEGLPTELGGIDDQPVTAAVANEPVDATPHTDKP